MKFLQIVEKNDSNKENDNPNEKKRKIEISKYVPSIKHWVETIEAMQYLWQQLQQKGFQFLCPRNCNQDPLENLFGALRSHGVRNNCPTPDQFQNSLKTLIINNFLAPRSLAGNVEEDNCKGGLYNLHELLTSHNVSTSLDVEPTFKKVSVKQYSPTADYIEITIDHY